MQQAKGALQTLTAGMDADAELGYVLGFLAEYCNQKWVNKLLQSYKLEATCEYTSYSL